MIHAFFITLAVLAAIYFFPIMVGVASVVLTTPAFWKGVAWLVAFGIACLLGQNGILLFIGIVFIRMVVKMFISDRRLEAELRDTCESIRDNRPMRLLPHEKKIFGPIEWHEKKIFGPIE
jgi:hypothetical protein